jgi:hypothetical protein
VTLAQPIECIVIHVRRCRASPGFLRRPSGLRPL